LSATYAGNSQTPAHTENYAYDANGYLTTVTIGGVVRAERVNDAAGRVVRYIERNENNSVRTDVTRTWDADGLQTLETDNLTGRTTTYTYSGEGSLNTVVSEGGGSAKTTTSYTYEWWDSAKQKEVKVQGDNGQSGWAPGFSRFTYDVNGNVKSATDVVGKREFRYLVDGDGQVLRRDEYLGSETNASGELVSARGNRSHSYYYLGGHRVGNVGNDGVERVDYAQELSRVTPEQTKAEDYYKRFKPSAGADFDENYMPINSGYPGSAPGAYTVRTGETLRSIATSLWGDAALWWVLADANWLSGDDPLVAGTVLRVPNKVTNVHNTSETYRPYDPGKALGNTSPTLPEPPPPPGRGGCGGFGAVLSVVVAVAVTAWTGGAASALLGSEMLGWAAAGALGSVAGQATAMATGVQEKFSWTGVALGAVGAGVTAGLTQAGSLSAALTKLGDTGSQIALGGIRSVVTQGIGVVTGLQSSFDWKGVAASAVAGGVGQLVGSTTLGRVDMLGDVAVGLSAGVASALVRGQSMSRNLGSIVADAVGTTIGNRIATEIAAASDRSKELSQVRERYAQVASSGAMSDEALQDHAQAYWRAKGASAQEQGNARELLEKYGILGAGPQGIVTVGELQHIDVVRPGSASVGVGDSTSSSISSTVLGEVLDGAIINGGRLLNDVGQYVQSRPGVELALQTLEFVLSPVPTLLSRMVDAVGGDYIEAAQSRVMQAIAEQYRAANYTEEQSGFAGLGGVFALGTLAGGGAKALRSIVDLGGGVAKAGVDIPKGDLRLRSATENVTQKTPVDVSAGTFSISDWTGYPAGVPKPEGPFRLLDGAEYNQARMAADRANRLIRREEGLLYKSVDVHEIHPVKFGGSPTDVGNKVILPSDVHRQQVTPWWNQLQRDLGGQ